MPTDLLHALHGSLYDELPRATALRERLHASPEPSHEERATAGLVAEDLGTESMEPVAGTGFVARVGPSGDAVAVRAELDALPIREETDAPFAAANGLMHACGHDVHMAALAAVFRAAGRVEGRLPKSLAALYQPSEEKYPSGADLVVKGGTLASGTAAVVAAHVHPNVPWGSVSVEPGPVNASCDYLRIVVEGPGGHGAYPHRARPHPRPLPRRRHAAGAGEPPDGPGARSSLQRGLAARGVGRERDTGPRGGGWHAARPPSRGPGAAQEDGPRDRRQYRHGARLLGKGGGDGGGASDGQRYRPGEGGALATPGGRLRAGAGDAVLRVGRLRLLRPRRSDAHALRRHRGRPEHLRCAAPPPAVPATDRSGRGRRPLPGRRLHRRGGPSRTGTRSLMGGWRARSP